MPSSENYLCPYSSIITPDVVEIFLISDEAFGLCIIKQYMRPPHVTDVAQRDEVALGVKLNQAELWRIQVFQFLSFLTL